MVEKPRELSYSLKTTLLEKGQWCSHCDRAKVNCLCNKLATQKKITKEGLGGIRD